MAEDEEDFGSDFDEDILEAVTQIENGVALVDGQDDVIVTGTHRMAPLVHQGSSLRQKKLDGSFTEGDPASSATLAGGIARKWRSAANTYQEEPTHHELDHEAIKTWVYPTNYPPRDYQYNIVSAALFNNVLVALPTGLGKTLIAATVMLNWYRWAPKSKVVFVAPTKPLVHQQVEACYNIVGIPRSHTAILTGEVHRSRRSELWGERRVFFGTPQTVEVDLSNGFVNGKDIVCLVIDEAHRASGNHAYVKVVSLIRRSNNSFRVLALTATPGSKVESVQNVIDELGISQVQMRTDDSVDIKGYIQVRTDDLVHVKLPPEIVEIKDLFCKSLERQLKKVCDARAFHSRDADKLSPYLLLQAMKAFGARQDSYNAGQYWSILKALRNLTSLAHTLNLLKTDGLRQFQKGIQNPSAAKKTKDPESGELSSEALDSIKKEPSFTEMMTLTSKALSDPDYAGHPKIDLVVNEVLGHFAEAEDIDTKRSTRIIIFASFRVTADEITRILKRHEPLVRPHIFIGQSSASDGSIGMKQKEQLEVMRQFKDGEYNTLVATSIGEEGLDVGEVDLIICYDVSNSPIRLIQRLGRTGRKRNGRSMILATDREEDSYKKALDNHKYMQMKVARGDSFEYHPAPRIIPKEIQSRPDKRHIDIPIENTQPEPERRQRGRKKAPPKRFFMPEGVFDGFTTAARLGQKAPSSKPEHNPEPSTDSEGEVDADTEPEESLAEPLDDPGSLVLTETEKKDLLRKYQYYGSADPKERRDLEGPRLDAFPEFQRRLTRTNEVGHGSLTKRFVEMAERMSSVDGARLEAFERGINKDLLKSPKKTRPFKSVRPSKGLSSTSGNVAAARGGQKKSSIETTIGRLKPKKPASKRSALSTDEEASQSEPLSPKRRRTVSAPGSEKSLGLNSDSDEMPDAKDLFAGFRLASGKKWGKA